MNRLRKLIAVAAISAVFSTGNMFAQDNHDQRSNDGHQDQRGGDNRGNSQHDNHQYVRHQEWKKGAHMQQQDWSRGEAVDYRSHHLRTPPRGYEGREVDGNYVMAVVATGVIASIIAATASH